jgi:hypothetical protein
LRKRDSQAGFRKGRGTMNHLRRIKQEQGRMYVLSVDFRVAFDKVYIEKTFQCMREKEREREGARGRKREREGERERERERKEERSIVTECWREKKINTEKKERKKYYRRNG